MGQTADSAPLTYTFFKGITPEEFMAQCDADRADRSYFSVLLGQDEWAAWAEALGLLGNASHVKKNQSNFNLAMDTGRPSALHRDTNLNFGKDFHATYKHQRDNPETALPRVCIHHVGAKCQSMSDAHDVVKLQLQILMLIF